MSLRRREQPGSPLIAKRCAFLGRGRSAISAQPKPNRGEPSCHQTRRLSPERRFDYGLRGCCRDDADDCRLRLHHWPHSARNGVEMFAVKVEQLGNALSIAYGGHVTADETRLCSEQVRLALNILKPGFRLLVDLTELETMDLSCSPFIANIMEM